MTVNAAMLMTNSLAWTRGICPGTTWTSCAGDLSLESGALRYTAVCQALSPPLRAFTFVNPLPLYSSARRAEVASSGQAQ
jgi:hypothetical protein